MSNAIVESGMHFIADNSFHIERSSLYTQIISNVKTVEFIRIKDNNLLFVEAKTSFSKSDMPSKGSKKRFRSELSDICEKFIHSLNLYSSVKIGISHADFPIDFIQNGKYSLKFVLVIRDFSCEWCRPIKIGITNALPAYFKKIWKPEIYVINRTQAINMQLVIEHIENEQITVE